MTATITTIYAALISGGVPPDATPADLVWLERNHRFLAEHSARGAWHGRQAFLCSELLATMKESAT